MEDQFGNRLGTGSQIACDAYVDALDRFLAADVGVNEAFQTAIDADESFKHAYIGLARNYQTTGRGKEAREILNQARQIGGDLDHCASAHLEVMGLVIQNKPDALPAARAHIAEFPRDVLIAQTCLGVFSLIGFSGKPGREAEHLACASQLKSHYGDHWWFQAQLAFAQMEAGQLEPAAVSMEKSLAANPRNANAAHYNAHLHYETGEVASGLIWLRDWLPEYDKSALLHCHLNWHVALGELASGDFDAMWSRVNRDIAPGGAWGPSLNVLTDMVALLFRAELAGVEVSPERWQTISQYAKQQFPRTGLGFADVHAALAHARAGNSIELDRVNAEARGPAADLVKCLSEAFTLMVERQWAQVTDKLLSVMSDHERLGGSRAQRDLIELALVDSLAKQGKTDEAKRLLPMRRPLVDFAGACVDVI